MCVAVVLAPGAQLAVDEVDRMMKANGDGMGFAWADGTSVQWIKALFPDPDRVVAAINKRIDMPRLVHFRLATAGGVKVELCHPFEIGPRAAAAAAGAGSKVMIHNGHWHGWQQIFDLYKREDLLPDTGPWSDTRFAAFTAAGDPDWLEVVGGRIAVMSYDGNITMYGSWDKLRDGVKCSNLTWQSHTYSYTRSGSNRHMMGWGWTNKEWEEYEKHEKDKRFAAAKELEDESKREKGPSGKGKEEGKAASEEYKNGGRGVWESHNQGSRGNVGVGTGHGNRGSIQTSGSSRGNTGEHSGGGNGERSRVQLGKISNGENANGQEESRKEGELYDHRPWFSPATKEWFYIPYDCEESGRHRFEKIPEIRARALLGETTASGGTSESSDS